jgi:glycosyltransferase involved in cell wall biosynthesis
MTESMNNGPLISAVIPTYNRTKQTFAAVESVLAQTYPHVEVIVVDDGSKDGFREIVEHYVREKASGGHAVKFVSQPNQGASAARNNGLAHASGEYVAFLDSDDIWLPEKLQWQLKALEEFKDECSVCFTDANLVNDAGMSCSSFEAHGRQYGQTIGIERRATELLAESFSGFWISSLMVKTETIRQIGGFRANISFVEDRDLHFRLSLVSSIAYVNKMLIRTDRNPSPPGSVCRPWDKLEVQFRQQRSMLTSWLTGDVPLTPHVRALVERALGSLLSYEANWHLENSRYIEARETMKAALQYKKTPGTMTKYALTVFAPVLAKSVAPRTRPVGTAGHAS